VINIYMKSVLVNTAKISPIGRIVINDYTSVSGNKIFNLVRPE